MTRLPWAVVLILSLLLFTAHRCAATPPDLDGKDRAILDELRRTCPAAVDPFERGTAALWADDYAVAESLLAYVNAKAPDFPYAFTSRAEALAHLGRLDEATPLARKACSLQPSPDNYELLIQLLLPEEGAISLSDAAAAEARMSARRMLDFRDTEYSHAITACRVGLDARDPELFQRALLRLQVVAPDSVATTYLQWFSDMREGNLDRARETIEAGRTHGLPDSLLLEMEAQTDAVKQRMDAARPWYVRAQKPVLWFLIAWASMLLVLFLVGMVLSRATLRAARQLPASPTGRVGGLSAAVRKAYRAVLWLDCAYFYLSIPILLLLVLGLGVATVYGFFHGGHIPIKLLILVPIFVYVTISATLKAMAVRAQSGDPGKQLTMEEHPRLRGLLDDVAGRIGTRPVDNVYLTPGTDFAVMERGGGLGQLRSGSERCLILGIGVLEGMRLDAFRAVLAHEYGHFSNRDTAGGGFALAVRRSTLAMAIGLAKGGAASWINPAWLFVNGFLRTFMRISQGASRLQEVLADRWAAFTYGADAFERGLRHVIQRSIRFDQELNLKLQDVIEHKKSLANVYRHEPSESVDEGVIAAQFQAALEAEPSPYDSHPRPADRIAWVQALDTNGATRSGEDGVAWDLFSGREAIEEFMTGQIRQAIQTNHGIEILGGGAA